MGVNGTNMLDVVKIVIHSIPIAGAPHIPQAPFFKRDVRLTELFFLKSVIAVDGTEQP